MALDIINRILPQNPDYNLQEDSVFPVISSEIGNIVRTRSLSTRPIRNWSLIFSGLTKQKKDAILNFYYAQSGGYNKFLFMPYKDSNTDYTSYGDGFSDIVGTTGNSSTTTQIYLESYMPAKDDLFNDWTIMIDGEHKIITDYDGSRKILTTQAFSVAKPNKTYNIKQKIGVGDGIKTSFDLIKNYGGYSETKKYLYDELTGSAIYGPKFYTHDGSTITQCAWGGYPPTQTPPNPPYEIGYALYQFANGDRSYYEMPLLFATAPLTGTTITASFYYLYPVRFHPEEAFSDSVFNANLFNLNTIKLQEVIEP